MYPAAALLRSSGSTTRTRPLICFRSGQSSQPAPGPAERHGVEELGRCAAAAAHCCAASRCCGAALLRRRRRRPQLLSHPAPRLQVHVRRLRLPSPARHHRRALRRLPRHLPGTIPYHTIPRHCCLPAFKR